MREERWMLSSELFESTREEPDEVIAFRILQESDWTHFMDSIEGNDALKFFNPELREFSCGCSWEDLCEITGVAPYDPWWSIPDDVSQVTHDFCREARAMLRDEGVTPEETSTPVFCAPSKPDARVSALRVTLPPGRMLQVMEHLTLIATARGFEWELYPGMLALWR